MSLLSDNSDVDYHRILARSLYFALLFNVLIPAVLLYICYYLAHTYFPPNRIGDLARPLFYLLVGLAVAQGLVAWWWRRKLLARPMVVSLESFQEDLRNGLAAASRPIALLVAAISLYGFLYFALTGFFKETGVLVLASFLAYQVVRPRPGLLRNLVERQRKMAEQGKLKRG